MLGQLFFWGLVNVTIIIISFSKVETINFLEKKYVSKIFQIFIMYLLLHTSKTNAN